MSKVNSTPQSCLTQFRTRLGPSGVHLFNRASGLNVLLDEIVVPEARWASAPRQVSIALTNTCDLACSYCFAPKTRATLQYDNVISWIDELEANGTIGVGFGGGEPTLYRRFAELCSYASSNTGLAVTFTTHGHHLSQSLLKELKGNIHFVRVSMDGVKATYEKLRGRSFESLRRRFSAIRNLAPFGINYVVNTETFHDLNAAVALAAEEGATEMLLLPERAVNGHGGISAGTAKELRAWLTAYRGPVRLAISENGAENMPTCNPFEAETGLHAYAHITADGILKATSYRTTGVVITAEGFLSALYRLNKTNQYEDME
jgi:MoaA/NifB/PqqE/SkfB family radical SAM enzyme